MKGLTGIVLALALATSEAFAPRAGFANRVMAARATATEVSLPASVKPGVVTGKALVDLLDYAKERGFAMPGVNIVGEPAQRKLT